MSGDSSDPEMDNTPTTDESILKEAERVLLLRTIDGQMTDEEAEFKRLLKASQSDFSLAMVDRFGADAFMGSYEILEQNY